MRITCPHHACASWSSYTRSDLTDHSQYVLTKTDEETWQQNLIRVHEERAREIVLADAEKVIGRVRSYRLSSLFHEISRKISRNILFVR